MLGRPLRVTPLPTRASLTLHHCTRRFRLSANASVCGMPPCTTRLRVECDGKGTSPRVAGDLVGTIGQGANFTIDTSGPTSWPLQCAAGLELTDGGCASRPERGPDTGRGESAGVVCSTRVCMRILCLLHMAPGLGGVNSRRATAWWAPVPPISPRCHRLSMRVSQPNTTEQSMLCAARLGRHSGPCFIPLLTRQSLLGATETGRTWDTVYMFEVSLPCHSPFLPHSLGVGNACVFGGPLSLALELTCWRQRTTQVMALPPTCPPVDGGMSQAKVLSIPKARTCASRMVRPALCACIAVVQWGSTACSSMQGVPPPVSNPTNGRHCGSQPNRLQHVLYVHLCSKLLKSILACMRFSKGCLPPPPPHAGAPAEFPRVFCPPPPRLAWAPAEVPHPHGRCEDAASQCDRQKHYRRLRPHSDHQGCFHHGQPRTGQVRLPQGRSKLLCAG